MISTKYPNDFWHKRKSNNFDPCNVFLAIATNMPVLRETGFVVQGHNVLFRLQCFWGMCVFLPQNVGDEEKKDDKQ